MKFEGHNGKKGGYNGNCLHILCEFHTLNHSLISSDSLGRYETTLGKKISHLQVSMMG
jgi:hypothetical protein